MSTRSLSTQLLILAFVSGITVLFVGSRSQLFAQATPPPCPNCPTGSGCGEIVRKDCCGGETLVCECLPSLICLDLRRHIFYDSMKSDAVSCTKTCCYPIEASALCCEHVECEANCPNSCYPSEEVTYSTRQPWYCTAMPCIQEAS